MRRDDVEVADGGAAVAGFEALKATKPKQTKDYVCCPVPLTAADRDSALLGAPEAPQLLKARALLRGGLPTAVNAGTHLWEVQQVPAAEEIAQAVDAGVYFKLFLKYCYVGAQVGEVHEFSAGNVCRQCGLSLGKAPDLVDVSTEGAAILAAQQGDLRIETSQAAFDALSDAVRRRKLLAAQGVSARVPWRTSLEAVIAACRASAEEGPQAVATALEGVLAAVAGHEAEPMDEVARATLWAPLTALQDELTAEVAAAIGPILPAGTTGRAKARSDEATEAMRQLDRMVRDPFVEGPRIVNEYWCAKAEAAGTQFAVREVRGARWFSISKEHNERLNRILSENADWYAGEVTEDMRAPLAAVGRSIGPLVRTWLRSIRTATTVGPWTVEEARSVLKTLVLQAWRDAVSSDSQMYSGVAAPATRLATASAVANWTRGLMYHYRQQYSRLEQENVAKILQQRAELERTSVVEEFKAIKDDDERAAELMKKRLRIGRWGLAAKGFREYDADMFEFENEQRRRMGIVDPPVDPILLAGAAPAAAAQDYGLGGAGGAPEAGYDAGQLADGDDY